MSWWSVADGAVGSWRTRPVRHANPLPSRGHEHYFSLQSLLLYPQTPFSSAPSILFPWSFKFALTPNTGFTVPYPQAKSMIWGH